MPPQGASNFVGMSTRKLTKGISTTPPRVDVPPAKTRSSWNASSRKASSKVTPKEPSPKKTSSTRSKSGASTPTKEPLKSCLKKSGSGPKSVPSSPPLSHRSECTQLSMRTDVSSWDQSSVLHDDYSEGLAKGIEFVSTDEFSAGTNYGAERNEGNQNFQPPPVAQEGRPTGRRREFPASFVEAFSRDEVSVADSPLMGPYLLKLAKSFAAAGENPAKALQYCIRAVKFYERQSQRDHNVLDLVISLHILAALHCQLGQYEDACELLERSLTLPDPESGGEEHALAAFNGHMQLGDTMNMVGKLKSSLQAYHRALDLQKSVLGEFDARVADTCVYIAEAHLQALEFAEARQLCEYSLAIHTEHGEPGSVEEATDHRLLAIICSAQGEHSTALDSLVYANDIFVNFDLQIDVATGNQSIGDELLALGRDAEALQCFGKCVTDFTMLRGEHDTLVASAHTSLADLFLRTNNPLEAKLQCQHALQIYARPGAGHVPCDVADGLVTIASILEQLHEHDTALLLLLRALHIHDRIPGQQATVAGLEAQIGILQMMVKQFKPAVQSFQSGVAKMRNGTLGNSPLVGLVVNQMGVACIELGDLAQAAAYFESARSLLAASAGPHHLDTLDVCNNLACTYASLERINEARDILEEVVRVKEEKLGAVHPDVCEDRERLEEIHARGQSSTFRSSRKLVEMLTSARKALHTSK